MATLCYAPGRRLEKASRNLEKPPGSLGKPSRNPRETLGKSSRNLKRRRMRECAAFACKQLGGRGKIEYFNAVSLQNCLCHCGVVAKLHLHGSVVVSQIHAPLPNPCPIPNSSSSYRHFPNSSPKSMTQETPLEPQLSTALRHFSDSSPKVISQTHVRNFLNSSPKSMTQETPLEPRP